MAQRNPSRISSRQRRPGSFAGAGSMRISMNNYRKDLGGAMVKSERLTVSGGQAYTVAVSMRSNTHREVRVALGNDATRVPVGPRWRRYVLVFRPTRNEQTALRFSIGLEDAPVWVDSAYVFKADAHVFKREFQRGLVLANATPRSKTIKVGSGYRRIAGIQDKAVNNGQAVTSVTLGPYDGIVLVKTNGTGGGGGSGDGGSGDGGSGTGRIGDFVWKDKNGDGIQNNSEPGVSGVKVKLRTCNGIWQAATVTDSGGRYKFTGLPLKKYLVEFVLPSGATFSPPKRGTSGGRDSDADRATGFTSCVDLGKNADRSGVDAGIRY